MRNLILHRKRALACFGIPYYCICSDDYSTVSGFPIANGQTITIPIPEEEQPIFVVIPTKGDVMFTHITRIPAGTTDVEYTVITDYNGYKIPTFRIEEGRNQGKH